jgi:hypothetical protein
LRVPHDSKDSRLQRYGWSLFIVCAFFFIADGITARSPLTIAASVIFLVGCVLFLIPLLRRG